MNVFDELSWRGLIANSTDPQALSSALAGRLTFYVGFDPTAPSLHMGNLVQLMVARRLQAAGHRPLLLVGGSTGLIGDPKESGERTMNPKEVVAEWVARIQGQVSGLLDLDGDNPATPVNNLDWTGPMSVIDFLRDIGKHFPVNRMLARDVVRNRLEDGISYSEFSYVLLQSLDYLELFRRYDCTLQFGGSDQWGNITAGAELIRRVTGERVHAMASPLLTKADGTKFGKTESGTVWLDPGLTSPYAFHQFFLNAEDEKVIDYLKVFSPRGEDEIAQLAVETAERPQARRAQRVLADDITTLVHSAAEAEAANAAGQALFGRGDLSTMDETMLRNALTEVGLTEVGGPELPTVADALALSGVVASKSAGRRAVAEGGAYLNNERVTDADERLRPDQLLHGRYVVLRRGRKTVAGLRFETSAAGV
ncbi:tyrosine--tRNA ligase [Naumannella halotolerans]|uniref:Tyrosine--tRNA ligase n=1 Tax=Naumannella halotolerans TaxID=993414 RepID=A0A4R7J6R1_9ACTN|nr:tyrosine--tRNA ligase [Naumannella halotolerans]TDT33091.1 tyrosyl-tRNA synthetase [Naumannella halotolerans]